jgi:hypothetical protein
MKKLFLNAVLVLFSVARGFSQEFIEKVDMVGNEANPIAVTMPDNGVMLGSSNGTDLVFTRFGPDGVLRYSMSLDVSNGSVETIADMKLQVINGNPNQNRIIVSGNYGNVAGFLSSLTELPGAGGLTLNWSDLMPAASQVRTARFIILQNGNYLWSLVQTSVNNLRMKQVNQMGGLVTALDRTVVLNNNRATTGFYIYDLVEDLPNQIVFVGGIKDQALFHEVFIGSINFNIVPVAINVIESPVTYTFQGAIHRNGSFNRIVRFLTPAGQVRFMVLGHINTINNAQSNNITLQQFDQNLNLITNPGPRVISFGSTFGNGQDAGVDLDVFPNTREIYFSGGTTGSGVFGRVNVNTNNPINLVAPLNTVQALGQRFCHFSFITPSTFWISSDSTDVAQPNGQDMVLARFNALAATHPCYNQPQPIIQNHVLNFLPTVVGALAGLNFTTVFIPQPAFLAPGFTVFCGALPGDCDAELEFIQTGCFTYRFNFSSNMINLSAWTWTVDGIVVQNGGFTLTPALTPGPHEICVHYFGVSRSNPNQICCDDICLTINVPTVQGDLVNLHYCEGDSAVLYNAATGFTGPYSYYILRELPNTTVYDSRTNGGMSHWLHAGSWVIDYFDDFGCLVYSLNINVIMDLATRDSCELQYTIDCGTLINLDSLAGNCCDTTEGQNLGWTELISNTTVEGQFTIYHTGVFRRVIFDRDSCKMCITRITIIVRREYNEVPFQVPCNPGCSTLTLANIQSMLNSQLPSLCPVYNSYDIIETDMFGNFISSFTIRSTGPTSGSFCTGRKYTIRPTDPNSCCELVLVVFCGASPAGGDDDNGIKRVEDTDFIRSFKDGINLDALNYLDAGNLNAHDPVFIGQEEARMQIVPNPTSAVFTITSNIRGIEVYDQVEIISTTGETIAIYLKAATDRQYDMRREARGLYTVKVKSGDSYFKLKLILN